MNEEKMMTMMGSDRYTQQAKPVITVLTRNAEGTYDRMRADDPRAQAIADALGPDSFVGIELQGVPCEPVRNNRDGTFDRLHLDLPPTTHAVLRYELVFWDGSTYTTLVPSR